MMGRRWLRWAAGFGLACVLLTGCDKLPFGQTAANTELDDEFADLDAEPSGLDKTSDPNSSAPADLSANPQEFALKLEVGQRFPLVKAVEQRLTQQLPSGPVVGHSRLELTMSLQVEEVRGPQKRLAVRYHRVRYAQDLGGQYVEYDTAKPVATIPPAAMAYSGLKDNGFSFWLGPDNRVGELIGFAEFVQRCVSGLPTEQRSQAFQQLQSLRGDEGLTTFVDDSIGLLPNPADPQFAGQPLKVGTVWQRTAALGSSSDGLRCLLKDLSPQSAEISLVGSIAPAIYVDPVHQLRLTVRSGQLSGTCVVDRTSGMPTQSRVERSLDMLAQLPDGTEIPQRKDILTTVTAFLDQSASASVTTHAAATGVQPAAYQPETSTPSSAWPSQPSQGMRPAGYP